MTHPIAAALVGATARLRDAGIPGADRDAKRLLCHVLGVAGHQVSPPYDHPALAEAVALGTWRAAFDRMIADRAAGRPVSKLIGTRAFWTADFIVTDDVLDPRPDTETLVEAALRAEFTRVLDLGTGSGCILLSLLSERPGATGVGTDLSPAALDVARRNGDALGLTPCVEWVASDWWAAVDGRFDLIVSNPPYIAADEMPGLAPEVRDHDPHMALTDGADGLTAYRSILSQVRSYLTPGGRVLVEIGPTQGQAVLRMMQQCGLVVVTVLQDLDGRDRVVAGQMPA